MDRVSLEQLLRRGLSLAEIGRRFGLHESTVGYWVEKHGLEAVNAGRHAPKGGLSRDLLGPLVEQGLSIAQIAAAVERSKSTVRHWLQEYRLTTAHAQRRAASARGEVQLTLRCAKHGLTQFKGRNGGGYRCVKCRTEAVSRRRRTVKRILVEEAGGACRLCGYDHCVGALEFHHVVPAENSFSMSHRGVARSIEKARREASKCVLLCANCHAEVEAGLATLP